MPQVVRPSVFSSLLIGTAAWSIPRQHAAFFPGEGSHLERYSSVLPCAEINSSFYRSHRPSSYTRWAASTPEHFRFSVKAPKTITHQSALAPARAQLQDFLDEVRHLGGKLGPILFQLPSSQVFEESRANAFFTLFRDLYPDGYAVLEPRNRSWFSLEVDNLLEQFRIGRVIADPAPAPEATQPGRYQKIVYYRLHGSPRVYYSSYSVAEIEKLANALSSHPAVSDIWCIFDNTASGAAIENALTLAEIARRNGSYSETTKVLV